MKRMNARGTVTEFLWSFFFLCVVWPVHAPAQDKIKVAYSSTDTLNQIWTIAQDAGFYKKNGLDVESGLYRQHDRRRHGDRGPGHSSRQCGGKRRRQRSGARRRHGERRLHDQRARL